MNADPSRFEGRDYVEGKHDCYGLLRDYYREVFDIHLENYARPADFAYAGLDLISRYFADEGFKLVEVSANQLQFGDVLLLRIGNRCPTVNHVGVCVGTDRMLHHVVDTKSVVDVIDQRWRRRMMSVVRHPEVAPMAAKAASTIEITQLLPPHVIKYLSQ